MMPIDGPVLTPSDTEKLMQSITPDSHISNVKLNGGADFGFAFGEIYQSNQLRGDQCREPGPVRKAGRQLGEFAGIERLAAGIDERGLGNE
jgi:hypothetical protein